MDEELFVVGDVQGCHQELLDLLAAAKFDPARHRLAFVGDLINRGPDSRGVLEVAKKHDARVVVGNHEDALLSGFTGETMKRVRDQLGADLDGWLAWIRALPTFLRIDDGRDGLILVHAGIAPGKQPEECTRAELTRIRAVDGKPWFESWHGPQTVVFGHWAKLGKVDRPLAKGLDTGCVYGGRLTGIFWPRGEWVSVPARQMWFDPIAHEPRWS
jgi:diadenosine tetraphosphatase ApaH/serine/threonine PP2A family protein phosphatase